MKAIYQYQKELEAARVEAETVFLTKMYEEAFQRGAEAGKFEQRMADGKTGAAVPVYVNGMLEHHSVAAISRSIAKHIQALIPKVSKV